MGSGCDSIGIAVVASDTRGPWFESSHILTFLYCTLYNKTKIKKKEVGNGPFTKTFVR